MKKLILLIILLFLISESLNSQSLFSLNVYFQQNQEIKSHILWETANDVFICYDNWTEEMKSDLDSVLQKIIHQQDLNIQYPIRLFNEPEPGHWGIPSLFFEDAWQIYLAHIAQTIIADHFNYISWDLDTASEEKLGHLFNGGSFYKFIDDHYEVKYEHGNATLGNPVYVFNFLRKNNLIGNNERNTIERILEWGRDNLLHYSKKPGETLEDSYIRWFNGFQGWYPPVRTIIDGVSDGEKIVHVIRGCHGTTGFLKAICRVINIEVQDAFYYGYMFTGHSQTVFPSINSFLCHADDVYSGFSKTYPRVPITKILFDFDSYTNLFNDELLDKNVSKSVELICDYLPYDFPNLYCNNGLDYILEGYGINKFFGQKSDSISQKLQSKMDSLIENYGGCYSAGHWQFFNKYGTPPFHNLKSEAELLTVSLNTPVQTNIVDPISQTIRITLDESLIPDSLIAVLICSDQASIKQLYGNRISIDVPNIFEVVSEDLLNIKIWKLIINDADDCQVQTENTIEVCEGESYKGWDTTGIYKDTLIAANGCDSIITTILTVHPIYQITVDTTICQGESYKGWTTSGQYTENLVSVNGCDSIIITNLTVDPSYQITLDTTLCEGENYKGWTTTGQYTENLLSVNGCDSVITTNLIVNPLYEITEDIAICEGEEHKGWTEPGTYYETLTTVSGCDSIVTTNLTVHPIHQITVDTTICEGESYKGWTTTGQYTENLVSVNGCDSVITTNLIVNPVYEITEEIAICEGEEHKGWTEAGTYYETLTTVSGCDSIVTTNLTIHPIYQITVDTTICEGESYKGWTTSGQYTENLVSVNGCDSTVITHLFILPSYQPAIEVKGDTLISVDIYPSYQWCDEGGEIFGETNKECIIAKSGEYYLIVVDENGCLNTSEKVQVIYSSISTFDLNYFQYTIIPNPNSGKFTFRIDSHPESDLTLKLVNTVGQVIEIREVEPTVDHTEQFDVSHLSKGIYHLVILKDKFQKSEKIVVQ